MKQFMCKGMFNKCSVVFNILEHIDELVSQLHDTTIGNNYLLKV